MKNVDDNTVPDDVQDLPIEGPEAEKAMEERAKATREKESRKSKEAAEGGAPPAPPREKEAPKEKEGLRGGTGSAGPLFQLPGDKDE